MELFWQSVLLFIFIFLVSNQALCSLKLGFIFPGHTRFYLTSPICLLFVNNPQLIWQSGFQFLLPPFCCPWFQGLSHFILSFLNVDVFVKFESYFLNFLYKPSHSICIPHTATFYLSSNRLRGRNHPCQLSLC